VEGFDVLIREKLRLHRRADFGAAAKEQGVDQRFGDGLALVGHGDVCSERAVDLPRLVEKHVQHDSVHGAVRAEVAHGFNDLGPLSVAVHAALALLQPVGVPGQIVVQHRVEAVLEVDPLAQAVRGDKHAAGFQG
jgi:hypothetical protein